MLALDYGIAVDASIPLEHEKTAESNVSRVRTRMRCISYELYYRMPLLLVGYLLMFIYLGRYVLWQSSKTLTSSGAKVKKSKLNKTDDKEDDDDDDDDDEDDDDEEEDDEEDDHYDEDDECVDKKKSKEYIPKCLSSSLKCQ